MAGPSSSRRVRGSIGRPKAEVVRDHFITVRVTAAEHFQFLDKARRSGITPTEYGRARILRGIARRKKQAGSDGWLEELAPLLETARALWHELRKIAVNLNQIAHHCNRHQVPPPAGYHDAVAALLDLLQRLTRR
jgi:hypothetical protein